MLVTNVSLHTTDRESKIKKRMELKMEVLRLTNHSCTYKLLINLASDKSFVSEFKIPYNEDEYLFTVFFSPTQTCD